jgi:hypothetical protein
MDRRAILDRPREQHAQPDGVGTLLLLGAQIEATERRLRMLKATLIRYNRGDLAPASVLAEIALALTNADPRP